MYRSNRVYQLKWSGGVTYKQVLGIIVFCKSIGRGVAAWRDADGVSLPPLPLTNVWT